MRSPETISINEESHQVPSWSIWAAALTFVLLESYLWLTSSAQPHRLPLGLRINFNLSWGLLLALYIVMVGFVSVDAPRRAMSMQLWILICFIMPGGIGAVLYFLLRQPEVSRCSGCGTFVQNDFHFCPQCNSRLSAGCGTCFCSVRFSDQFCTRCGRDLAEAQMPARA